MRERPMKSILLHIQDDEGLESRLQVALDIARATGGHVTCLHVTPFTVYGGMAPLGSAYAMREIMDAFAAQEEQMRAKIEAALLKEDVPWTYSGVISNPRDALISSASLADLIVMSPPAPEWTASSALVGSALVGARTPTLVVPNSQFSFDVTGHAMFAWNGSTEAANALRAALPLLRLASSVTIFCVEEESEDRLPPLGASEYLSRHGVPSVVHSENVEIVSVEDQISANAKKLDANFLGMGAFGHSRAREFWFGGVTRAMMRRPPVPVLFGR